MRKIYLFDMGLLAAAVTVAGVLAEEPLYPAQLLKASISEGGHDTTLQSDDTTTCGCETPSQEVESCHTDESAAGQGT